MYKLYKKSELAFAIVCIVVYSLLQSVANPLNKIIGIENAANAIFNILLAVIFLLFIIKNKLTKYYGLCKTTASARYFLFYIPLAILCTVNFWNGATVNFSLINTISYLCYMLFVGLVEEILFRGLLFKAIAKDNIKLAIIISSVTFGLGHLLHLINGSGVELVDNLFQVFGAIAMGFLFVILFYRGDSLLPCIITHSIANMTSTFANETGLTIEKQIIFSAIKLVIIIAYIIILVKVLPKNQCINTNIDDIENNKEPL